MRLGLLFQGLLHPGAHKPSRSIAVVLAVLAGGGGAEVREGLQGDDAFCSEVGVVREAAGEVVRAELIGGKGREPMR